MLEKELNYYFNIGKFNHPEVIGYVMNEIRKANPITLNQWRNYYYNNVRSKEYLDELALKMFNSIPIKRRKILTLSKCKEYIDDVIFRRTFEGFNRENQALNLLNELLNNKVELSPKEWDGKYFIDFIINKPLIGIQLKPKTFYDGHYDVVTNIDQKLEEFEQNFNAKTFILVYEESDNNHIEIINMEVVDEIKQIID